MLEPLNARKLRALMGDDDGGDCSDLQIAKSFFAKGDLAEGIKNLLEVFNLGVPSVYREKKDPEIWHIQFREPPFDTLFLRPCGGTIEIFKGGKFLIAFGILKRPQNWARILQWIWAYGDEAYTINVKKGYMLRPLDYRKLRTLVQEDNDTDCNSVRRTKARLGKEKDLARGVMSLFEGWEVFAPRIDRDKEVENNWRVTFRNSPFRSLRIEPGTDHGIVDVYTFDEYHASFQILDNFTTPDREMWQRLLRFVWDYGWRRQIHKQRWEDKQRQLPGKKTKSRSQSKRTEKPLLHKVLHTASFKAQRAPVSGAKNAKIIPGKEDNIMGDIDTGAHVEKSSSHQHFNQQSPLLDADPNAQLGRPRRVEDTKSGQTAKVDIDDINMGGLEIMDCQS